MSKLKHSVSRYRVGSKDQYKGLVEHHKQRTIFGGHERDKTLNEDDGKALLDQYNSAIKRISEEGLESVKEKSTDWDLNLMIPHLANQHFYAYLEMIGLPFKFDRAAWTRKKPKVPERSKPCYSAFERFRRYVSSKTRFLGLKPHELAGVRLALDGLQSLDLAQSHAMGSDFKNAAVHIGRAMPIAAFVKIIEMEHSYQIGEVRQKTNRLPKVSKVKRKPILDEIIRKIAKHPGKAKELWPLLFGELDNESFSPREAEVELKYFYKDTNGKDQSIAFSTFQNRLSAARRNKISR